MTDGPQHAPAKTLPPKAVKLPDRPDKATLKDVETAEKQTPPHCGFLANVKDPNKNPNGATEKAANAAFNRVCVVKSWPNESPKGITSASKGEVGEQHANSPAKKENEKHERRMSADDALKAADKAARGK